MFRCQLTLYRFITKYGKKKNNNVLLLFLVIPIYLFVLIKYNSIYATINVN